MPENPLVLHKNRAIFRHSTSIDRVWEDLPFDLQTVPSASSELSDSILAIGGASHEINLQTDWGVAK